MNLENMAETSKKKVKEQIENLPNHNFGQNNVQNMFNVAYSLAGLVATAFIVYGAVQYITANGDTGKVAKAKNAILYSVIGLLIVLLAAAITYFVINAITTAE